MEDDKELLELGATPVSDDQVEPELAALGAQPYRPEGEAADALAKYISKPQSTSMSEAFGLGAVEGGTLGWADEAGAGLGAGLEYANQDLGAYLASPMMQTEPNETYQGPKSLSELYDEYLKYNRDRFDKAQQEHPTSYLLGNLGAGLALPIGSAGKVAKEAPMMAKIKEGFQVGSKLGTVAGAGISDAPMLSGEFAIDTGMGTATGGVLGAAAPPVLTGISKGAEKTADVLGHLGERLVGPVREAYRMGRSGQNIISTAGLREAKKEIGQFAGSVAPQMQSELNRLAKLYDKILNQARERGIKIDEEALNSRLNNLLAKEPESNLPKVRAELEDLQELLRTYKEGRLVRKEIKTEVPSQIEAFRHVEELKRAEQAAIESGVDPNDIETVYEEVDVPGKVAAVVRQIMRKYDEEGNPIEVTGFKKLASRLVNEEDIPGYKTRTEIVREGGEDITDLGVAEQLRLDLKEKSPYGGQPYATQEVSKLAGQTAKGVRDLQREALPQLAKVDKGIEAYKQAAEALGIKDTIDLNEAQIRDRLISFIAQEEKAGVQSIKVIEKLDEFIEAIGRVNPPMAEKLRNEVTRMGSKLNAISSVNQDINLLSMNSWLGLGRKFAPAATNLAGVGVGAVERGVKKAGEAVVNMTVNRTPEWMVQKAQTLAQRSEPAAQELRRVLIEAASKEERARNAIVFGIMQNPAFRKLLDEEGEVK